MRLKAKKKRIHHILLLSKISSLNVIKEYPKY